MGNFFAESFVNKESMCNFAAQFNREIFKPLTFNLKKMIVVPVKEGENIEKALKKF